MAKQRERKLHESTSRLFCQLAFVLLALLPLSCCMFYCVAQRFSFYHRFVNAYYERQVFDELGLKVTVDRIVPRAPNRSTVLGLRLCNPETEEIIFEASSLQIERFRGQCMIDQVEGARLDSAQLALAWPHVNKAFLERKVEGEDARVIGIQELAVSSPHHEHGLYHVQLKVLPHLENNSTKLQLSCQLQNDSAAEGSSNSINVIVERFHEPGQLATLALLRTGAQPLPTNLLFDYWPALENLGLDAKLFGVARLKSSMRGWELNVGSEEKQLESPLPVLSVYDVDFSRLSWNSGFEFNGRGQLSIQSASVTEVGLRSISGNAIVNSGYVRRATLLGMRDHLGLLLGEGIANSTLHDIQYKLAFCKFKIEPNWVQLEGYREPSGQAGTASGTLWDNQSQPLAAFPPGPVNPLPLSALITVMKSSKSIGGQEAILSNRARKIASLLPITAEALKAQGLRLSRSVP